MTMYKSIARFVSCVRYISVTFPECNNAIYQWDGKSILPTSDACLLHGGCYYSDMEMPSFIHLRVHSVYSLLEGAIALKPLVKWAKQHRMPAIAVTDHANLFGALEFCIAAKDLGIQPIVGCVLQMTPAHNEAARNQSLQKPEQLLVYAQNEIGWQNLLALVSMAYLQPAQGQAPLIAPESLHGRTEGLLALSGGIDGTVGRALIAGRLAQAESALLELSALFPGRFYMEISRHGLPEEQATEPHFLELAYKHQIPLIATNDAYFIEEDMYDAHDAFICIAEGSYVGEDNRRKLTPHHRLKTPQEMSALFSDLPEALWNTAHFARRCAFMATQHPPILPHFTEGDSSEADELRRQAREGLTLRLERYVYQPSMSTSEREATAKPYLERLEFELETIIKMKFPGYFLIVSDFIKWSKAQGIPVGPGRGSGAGSLVAWAMMITDLDPLRYGLLFERFLNPQRVSMPDFDVDFCQDRREEVIRYVQQRYGHDRVAQIITFGTLQARAALRDVGRVLQMPYGQVDKICKLVPSNPANPVSLEDALDIEPMLKAAMEQDDSVRRLIDVSIKLEGLNRHASTHAAGVVIGDRPLQQLVAMYRDPKSDMPVVQYSMKYAEMAGLVKFDFLGLKTLTVLVRAIELLRPRHIDIDLLALPEGDKPTYQMLGRGDTVGVFQLESAGMRDTLKKLRPDCLEDIIALVSLYRPGPMDNIPTYIARKHGEEKPEYLHPLLESVLKETFGVIIYQEQVMQIAQLLAGYSLGEADLLRRAMGKKIREEMEAQRSIFVDKAVERGVDKSQAASIFDLIAKFAEYGFNKSHAAAYALIAYQTAYLKANYPVEFIAASMTYDMHNTDKIGIFTEDALRLGVKIYPPDVNTSEVLFSVENGAIRYALAAVRNVGAQAMEMVVAERRAGGAFKDIFDFVARVPHESLNKRAMEFLIKAGAFDTLGHDRHRLFANLDLIFAYADSIHREKGSNQVSLFGGDSANSLQRPSLAEVQPWSQLERLEQEFSAIGFYLSAHPLAGYVTALESLNVCPSNKLPEKLGSQYKGVKVAGIVTGRKFKASDKGRFAFLQLSDRAGLFEVSIFDENLLNRQRELLENGKILLITADGKNDDSGVRLIAQQLCLLDEALLKQQEARGNTRFCISVRGTEALAPLKGLLGEPNGRGAQVFVKAQFDQEAALIELPGKYLISPAIMDRIRILSGVLSAEELA